VANFSFTYKLKFHSWTNFEYWDFPLWCHVMRRRSETNYVLHDTRNCGTTVTLQNDAARILYLPSVGNMSNYTCKRQGLPIPTEACSVIPCSTIPTPARLVLLTFPGSSWFQSMKLQDCITLHLHENWMQFLKQITAAFDIPYKECYQDVTRWVFCSAAQYSDAKYYKSQPNAQLYYTKTLKIKTPTCFDPRRIIIREYTHKTIMYKTLQWWKHVGIFNSNVLG